MRSLVFLALLTIAAAHPVRDGFDVGKRSPVSIAKNGSSSPPPTLPTDGGNGIHITSEVILAVSPEAKSCDNAQFPDECRTAKDAAPFVNDSFDRFNITTKPEAAAILSLMLLESGGFRFNIHHFPSLNHGQGTRNMMNFKFILEYAHDVLLVNGQNDPSLPPISNADIVNNTVKDNVLEKVLGNDFSFATGAWFYQKQCDNATKQAVRSGSEDGWRQYIEHCVNTTVTEDRLDGWNKTTQALLSS